MAPTIKHKFTTAKADGADNTLVKPSNWNDSHDFEMSSGVVIGRQTAGAGPMEEVTVTPDGFAILGKNIADILAYLGVSPPTTGDGKLTLKTAADPGWVMMDDGTIGALSSGASTRANADALALFTLLYAAPFTDASVPLFTSTGAATTRAAQGTAAAAFAAGCRISLPKQVGRAIVGAGSGVGLTTRTLGTVFGSETAALSTGNLPSLVATGTVSINTPAVNIMVGGAGGAGPAFSQSTAAAALTGWPTLTASFSGGQIGGSSTPFSISQASLPWNVMVKL